MKYLIFSDLHGSSDSAWKIVYWFKALKCDKLICLGDVLYHGPRNDLPPFYEPKEVIKCLNVLKDKLLCVSGNCDAEVDEMVLDFPLQKKLSLNISGLKCFFHHGHHEDCIDKKADVIFFGHTHIPVFERKGGKFYLNPGSVTIPKGNSQRSFILLDERKVYYYNLDGKLIKSEELN